MGRHVGVDLHKRRFQVCYLSKGKVEQREFIVSKAGMEAF